MSFKQKLEQAAAELMTTKRAYEQAREHWDKLCSMLPALSEAEQMEKQCDPENLQNGGVQ